MALNSLFNYIKAIEFNDAISLTILKILVENFNGHEFNGILFNDNEFHGPYF